MPHPALPERVSPPYGRPRGKEKLWIWGRGALHHLKHTWMFGEVVPVPMGGEK